MWPYLSFRSDPTDTEVQPGETTQIIYSVNNFLTSDELTAQLLVETPSDVNITGVRGAEEGANQFTAVATLPPNSQENIQIDLTVNAAGAHAISAIADYYVGDSPDNSDRTVESLVITAEEPPDQSGQQEPESQPEAEDSIPGFGIGEALASVGGAAYLLKRRLVKGTEQTE